MRLLIQSHVDNAKARDKGIDVICYAKLTQWLKITVKSLILHHLRAKRAIYMRVSSNKSVKIGENRKRHLTIFLFFAILSHFVIFF